jgi:outer membrane protein OmpA-like peptidoglycan-associated protein
MKKTALGWGVLFLCAADAAAQEAPLDANTLSLDSTGTGFLTTGNGTVLDRGQLHIMTAFHHLDSPVVWRTVDTAERIVGDDRLPALVPRREQVDLALSMGIWHRLQLSARLPVVLDQGDAYSLCESELTGGSSLADPELGLHAAVLDGQLFPVQIGLSVPVTVPVSQTQNWTSHGSWTMEPRLTLATLHGPVQLTSRVGYRLQEDAVFDGYERGDLLRTAVGLSWHQSDGFRVGLELVGELDLWSADSEVLETLDKQGLELLAGTQIDLGRGFRVTAGLGPGLTAAIPTPRWRGVAALSWTMQAIEPDPCKHVPAGEPLPPECPDPLRDDLDQDGILNEDDGCPVDPEDFDGLQDLDGCPEIDADQDQILDPVDICPLEPETVDGVRDEDGCPDDQLVALTRTSVVQLQRVTFDFAQASIKPESEQVLWAVLEMMDRIPSLILRVEGHTDNVGSDTFNAALSVARAQACREWLIDNATNPEDIGERVKVLGLGETLPTDTNRTVSGKAENRRVEFVVESLDESPGIPLFRAMEELDGLPSWMSAPEE